MQIQTLSSLEYLARDVVADQFRQARCSDISNGRSIPVS